jgi:hypothetical protein
MGWRLALIGLIAATPAPAAELPLPPVPPAQVSRSLAAPVPDSDLQAPPGLPDTAPTVGLKLYRAQTFDQSLGFTPGSRYQTSEDRKPIQTPGFSVSVPLK